MNCARPRTARVTSQGLAFDVGGSGSCPWRRRGCCLTIRDETPRRPAMPILKLRCSLAKTEHLTDSGSSHAGLNTDDRRPQPIAFDAGQRSGPMALRSPRTSCTRWLTVLGGVRSFRDFRGVWPAVPRTSVPPVQRSIPSGPKRRSAICTQSHPTQDSGAATGELPGADAAVDRRFVPHAAAVFAAPANVPARQSTPPSVAPVKG
jgi:hypothetical protein